MVSNNQKNYITPSGLEKLKAEYNFLIQVERPRIVETVAWAASNGDRSENADYIYGKRRLREIDYRLGFLLKRMENAEVVNPSEVESDRILFGATVYIEDENGNSLTYQIVGEDEIDISSGKISWRSPVATALLGKKTGDEVIVQKPKGPESVYVIQIDYK